MEHIVSLGSLKIGFLCASKYTHVLANCRKMFKTKWKQLRQEMSFVNLGQHVD